MEERVLIYLRRLVGSTVATHVGRHRVEPRLRESAELMAPRVPGLGKAVTEDDQHTWPCSATCIWMPFVSTVRCWTSVMVVTPILDQGRNLFSEGDLLALNPFRQI